MSQVPIPQRFVEVVADLGERVPRRWRYGSGLLVGGQQVLTAAHVVVDAVAVTIRGVDKKTRSANLALMGNRDNFDLALLDVPECPYMIDDLPIAVVDRNAAGGEFIEQCWAVGYPSFQEVRQDNGGISVRETAHVKGRIPPWSGLVERMLSLQVTASPRRLPRRGMLDDSPWSGMSGAAVFAKVSGRNLLVGVVTEHSPRRGSSDITVTPLDRLLDSVNSPPDARDWWIRLGVTNVDDLKHLPARPEPTYWATLQAIHNRTGVLLDREDCLSQIAAFAAGDVDAFGAGTSSQGYLWLVGAAWAGKTALVAEAVHVHPPDVDVVAYFLNARETQASGDKFLAAVVPQLAWLLEQDVPAEGPSLPVFRALWVEAVQRAKAHGRHLFLVVDGLDEDLRPGGRSVAALLPTEHLASNAHVLVTSRLQYELPADVDVHHPLQSIRTPVQLADSPHAARLKELADQEINLLLADPSNAASEVTFEVLGILAAAAGPLSVDDLAEMLTEVQTYTIRHFVTHRAARSLQPVVGGGDVHYEFAHLTLLERCKHHRDIGHPRYRDLLHSWANRWRDWGWQVPENASSGAGSASSAPQYLFDEYPAVLAGDPADPIGRPAEPQRLVELVTDVRWIDSAVSCIGIDQVLAALRTTAKVVPDDSTVESMSRLLSLQSHHLRYPHPVGRTGFTATQLAWEALSAGLGKVVLAAADRIRQCPEPQLVPIWTSERTSPYLAHTIDRYSSGVQALAATDDGHVVSGGEDCVIRLWDSAKPDDPGRVLGHPGSEVRALSAVGGGWVVSGTGNGAVQLWDLARAGSPLRTLGHHAGRVRAMVVTAGHVVSGGDDGVVRLWNFAKPGDPGRELGRPGRVWALAAIGDGRVVSGGDDGVVRLWDPADPGDRGRELGRHTGRVRALAATADGRVVSGGDDGENGLVRLWDPANPGDPGQELGRHRKRVWAVAVTRGGQVVSAGGDGAIRLWDPVTPGDPGRKMGRHAVWALAATPDGRVVSGGDDGAVRLWDLPRPGDPSRDLGRHAGQVWAVAAAAHGCVVSGTGDGVVRLWDPAVPGDPGRDLGRHTGQVRALAATSDGRVVSGGGGVVRLWDPAVSGDAGQILGTHAGRVRALVATSDGWVVSGGEDGAVRLWDPVDAGDPGLELGRHEKRVLALATTGNGQVISGGGDGVVRLWDPAHPGREQAKCPDVVGAVGAVAATGDGRVVFGTGDGFVRLWDPAVPGDPGRELGRHTGQVLALATTGDGWVVSGGDDGVVRLWDPANPTDSGQELANHAGAVRALAATSDGRVIAAISGDLTVFQMELFANAAGQNSM